MSRAIELTTKTFMPTGGQVRPSVTAMTIMTPKVGLPAVQSAFWHAVLAPAGTPCEIVARLNQTLVAAVAAPELRAQLLNQGALPVGSTPGELGKFMQAEADKWGRVIRSSGARAD